MDTTMTLAACDGEPAACTEHGQCAAPAIWRLTWRCGQCGQAHSALACAEHRDRWLVDGRAYAIQRV